MREPGEEVSQKTTAGDDSSYGGLDGIVSWNSEKKKRMPGSWGDGARESGEAGKGRSTRTWRLDTSRWWEGIG